MNTPIFFPFSYKTKNSKGEDIALRNGFSLHEVERYHETELGELQIVLKSMIETYQPVTLTEGKHQVSKQIKTPVNATLILKEEEDINLFFQLIQDFHLKLI